LGALGKTGELKLGIYARSIVEVVPGASTQLERSMMRRQPVLAITASSEPMPVSRKTGAIESWMTWADGADILVR